jgi:hypothetical protein
LAILRHVTGFEDEAREFYTLAYTIYSKQLGDDNESVLAIKRSLDELPQPAYSQNASRGSLRASTSGSMTASRGNTRGSMGLVSADEHLVMDPPSSVPNIDTREEGKESL